MLMTSFNALAKLSTIQFIIEILKNYTILLYSFDSDAFQNFVVFNESLLFIKSLSAGLHDLP